MNMCTPIHIPLNHANLNYFTFCNWKCMGHFQILVLQYLTSGYIYYSHDLMFLNNVSISISILRRHFCTNLSFLLQGWLDECADHFLFSMRNPEDPFIALLCPAWFQSRVTPWVSSFGTLAFRCSPRQQWKPLALAD